MKQMRKTVTPLSMSWSENFRWSRSWSGSWIWSWIWSKLWSRSWFNFTSRYASQSWSRGNR
jgi:hypothetical protein